jgi:predicted O-methyltransferase YrrM
MHITSKKIEKYCVENSSPIHQVLYELDRETNLKTLAPQMISGHLQGKFLQMICQMIQPKKILEIGTFTGYSAISMAIGSPEDVMINTIEINEEHESMIRKYIHKTGYHEQIQLHIGDAFEILPGLAGPFDLVFIDAGKQDYQAYFDLIIPYLKNGSFILSDNVLWDGKVLLAENDDDTKAIKAYNQQLKSDPRVEVLMLPIRDGISIARVV